MIKDVLSDRGRFAALAPDHPGVGTVCPGCGEPLEAGERPALVNSKTIEGEQYTVEAVLAHERCAYPNQPELTSPKPFQNEVGSGS